MRIQLRRVLTVTGDGVRFCEEEAILAFPCRDLSVRELGKEFRLFVVLEVGIRCGEVDL